MLKLKALALFTLLSGLLLGVSFADNAVKNLSDKEFKAFVNNPGNIVTGNPNGSITIVDMFDYNCIHCKHLSVDLDKVVKANPNVKLIRIPLGVLGGSMIEAKYATAANLQGKFDIMDAAMIKNKDPMTAAQLDALATKLGLNVDKLKADINSPEVLNALLDNSIVSFGATGIPMVIVGNTNPPYKAQEMIGGDNLQKVLSQYK